MKNEFYIFVTSDFDLSLFDRKFPFHVTRTRGHVSTKCVVYAAFRLPRDGQTDRRGATLYTVSYIYMESRVLTICERLPYMYNTAPTDIIY